MFVVGSAFLNAVPTIANLEAVPTLTVIVNADAELPYAVNMVAELPPLPPH
jgi:hypothetical protein